MLQRPEAGKADVQAKLGESSISLRGFSAALPNERLTMQERAHIPGELSLSLTTICLLFAVCRRSTYPERSGTEHRLPLQV